MPIRIDEHPCTSTASHMWIQCLIKPGGTVVAGAFITIQLRCDGFLHADGQACGGSPAVCRAYRDIVDVHGAICSFPAFQDDAVAIAVGNTVSITRYVFRLSIDADGIIQCASRPHAKAAKREL